jgi:hypothetical protein
MTSRGVTPIITTMPGLKAEGLAGPLAVVRWCSPPPWGGGMHLALTLTARFGPLPSWCLHALRRADAAELRQLRSRVSFFDGNRCDKWHRQCDTASI